MDVCVSKTPDKDLGLHNAANHPGDDKLPKCGRVSVEVGEGGTESEETSDDTSSAVLSSTGHVRIPLDPLLRVCLISSFSGYALSLDP